MTTLAEPLSLTHGPTWRNRLALAPLTNLQSHPDGTLSEDEIGWLAARAEGGFGLTMTAAAYVARAGNPWRGQLGISDEAHRPGLERLAEAIRAGGSVSCVQLQHGGARADAAVSGEPVVAPWDDPEKGARALSTGEVQAAVESFVDAAVMAEQTGWDGVQVHGAHGYLVGQFLDSRRNGETTTRTDGYGGDLAARSRFLTEVLRGVRAGTGPDFQVGLRLSPERFGIPLAEGRELAGQVLASGLVDHLDLSVWDVRKASHTEPPRPGDPRLLIDHFTDLPRHGTRLGVAGEVLSAADAARCLDRGADFVTVGIGAILHHDFAARAVADAGFAAAAVPVSREHLAAERVSPAFVDYLARGWPHLVAR